MVNGALGFAKRMVFLQQRQDLREMASVPAADQLLQSPSIGRVPPLPCHQDWQSQLAVGQVRPERLADRGLRPEQINAIIVNLVGCSQDQAVFPERGALAGSRAAEPGPQI